MSFLDTLFSKFTSQNTEKKQAESLYWRIVEISRDPYLYTDLAISDNIDGRFDSVLLHIYPLLEWMNNNGHYKMATEMLNIMINDMDRSLRQSGVGDPSITRKMRKIGEAYMGRVDSYKRAFDTLPEPTLLSETLFRNVYRSDERKEKTLTKLMDYVLKYYQAYSGFSLNDNDLPNIIPALNHGGA